MVGCAEADNENRLKIDVANVVRNRAPQWSRRIPNCVFHWLERTICQDQLNHLLTTLHGKEGVDFASALIEYLNVHIDVRGAENIPHDGKKYTFVSNHPLGALDGIAIIALLGKEYKGKIKFLVNDILMAVKPFNSVFLPINKHGAQAKDNTEKINEAYDGDNQMIVFPAGLVSRLQKGKICDLEWKKAFITKSVNSKRDIVPIYFEGLNTPFFYRIAKLRRLSGLKFNIEMIYLPREIFRCKNRSFTIHIGAPISWQTFDNTKTPMQWAEYVKTKVYNIQD